MKGIDHKRSLPVAGGTSLQQIQVSLTATGKMLAPLIVCAFRSH